MEFVNGIVHTGLVKVYGSSIEGVDLFEVSETIGIKLRWRDPEWTSNVLSGDFERAAEPDYGFSPEVLEWIGDQCTWPWVRRDLISLIPVYTRSSAEARILRSHRDPWAKTIDSLAQRYIQELKTILL